MIQEPNSVEDPELGGWTESRSAVPDLDEELEELQFDNVAGPEEAGLSTCPIDEDECLLEVASGGQVVLREEPLASSAGWRMMEDAAVVPYWTLR